MAFTRGLMELDHEKQQPQDNTGGKALLLILTQLASKRGLLPIYTAAPKISPSQKVVLSGTSDLSDWGKGKIHF